MNILITGNMGYVGSELVYYLRKKYPYYNLIGFDIGYFDECLTNTNIKPEKLLDHQYLGDIRKFDKTVLKDIDAIVHLAAISNDPIGNMYGKVTNDVNYLSSIKLAKEAYLMGVKSFVFASSCSVYGNGTTESRTESCDLLPLTEYAKSKVSTEKSISELADNRFKITNLRFSTACGMSKRLRLDLVLNDFVASAISNKEIKILSDGTPWRPLINVKDMARAIDWAINRNQKESGDYLTVNVGDNRNNIMIKDLAEIVKNLMPDTEVTVNKNAAHDNRSYKVDFNLFNSLAKDYLPKFSLEETVNELKTNLTEMNFNDINFRNSDLIRLKKLNSLKSEKKLNQHLEWCN